MPRPDGTTIAVHDLAPASDQREVLLLVHATGFHGQVWAPMVAELPASLGHPWAVDLRGHGASGPLPPGEVTWAQSADDVLAVVAALEADGPVRAVGHSMGGAVLLMAEARRPRTSSSIYAYEPIVLPEAQEQRPEAGGLAAGARRRRPWFASRAEAEATYAAKAPLSGLRADALAAYVAHGFVDRPDGSVALACDPEDEAATFDAALGAEARHVLGDVHVPVAVATGRLAPGPPTWARAAVDLLPRGEHRSFPQLGHLGPMEDPAAVAADVATWFAAHP